MNLLGRRKKGPVQGLWYMAERVGFEPTVGRPTTVFKTVSFDHSDTSPKEARRITESISFFQLDLTFHPIIL